MISLKGHIIQVGLAPYHVLGLGRRLCLPPVKKRVLVKNVGSDFKTLGKLSKL